MGWGPGEYQCKACKAGPGEPCMGVGRDRKAGKLYARGTRQFHPSRGPGMGILSRDYNKNPELRNQPYPAPGEA
jgi:hypothetical protein